jgi:hypothetical protein
VFRAFIIFLLKKNDRLREAGPPPGTEALVKRIELELEQALQQQDPLKAAAMLKHALSLMKKLKPRLERETERIERETRKLRGEQ